MLSFPGVAVGSGLFNEVTENVIQINFRIFFLKKWPFSGPFSSLVFYGNLQEKIGLLYYFLISVNR